MICSNCKMRWADFPKEDFTIDDNGIHAKGTNASSKRLARFKLDDVAYCGCIERDEAVREQDWRYSQYVWS